MQPLFMETQEQFMQRMAQRVNAEFVAKCRVKESLAHWPESDMFPIVVFIVGCMFLGVMALVPAWFTN